MIAHWPEAVSSTPSADAAATASASAARIRSRQAGSPRSSPTRRPLAIAAAGIGVAISDDERSVLWGKAARLAVLAAATVASGRAVGALRDDGAWRARMRTAVEEAVTVAEADGVVLAAADQWAMIEAMPPELTTSAARDAAAGRRTELDAIVGSVVRAGRRHGVPMPVFEALLTEAEEAVAR